MMLVLPADHVVTGEPAFKAAVALGAQLAAQGHLVTFGIKPTRPETGYGYIQPNRRKSLAKKGRLTGHPVARFVEKPNRTKAAQYLKNGNFYWNSGMFLWKASTILEEIQAHQPQLAGSSQRTATALHSLLWGVFPKCDSSHLQPFPRALLEP